MDVVRPATSGCLQAEHHTQPSVRICPIETSGFDMLFYAIKSMGTIPYSFILPDTGPVCSEAVTELPCLIEKKLHEN